MEKELVDLQRRQLLLYQLKVFQLWNAVKVVFQNPTPPEHHLWLLRLVSKVTALSHKAASTVVLLNS